MDTEFVEGGCLCGSIRYRVSGRKDETDSIDLTTASLDEPARFAPEREIWTAEKIAWEKINDSLRQYPGSSRGKV